MHFTNLRQNLLTLQQLKLDRKQKFQFRPKPKVTPKTEYYFRPKTETKSACRVTAMDYMSVDFSVDCSSCFSFTAQTDRHTDIQTRLSTTPTPAAITCLGNVKPAYIL